VTGASTAAAATAGGKGGTPARGTEKPRDGRVGSRGLIITNEEVVLLDVGEDLETPAAGLSHSHGGGAATHVRIGVGAPGGEIPKSAVVVVEGDADLLEVVLAFRPVGGLAHLLHGRQEERHQDGDDGDHHQQLDQ